MLLFLIHLSENNNGLTLADSMGDAEIITQSEKFKNGFHFPEQSKPSSEILPVLLNYIEEEDQSCYFEIMKNQKQSCRTPTFQEKQIYCIQLTQCYMNSTGQKDKFFKDGLSRYDVSDMEKLTYHSEFANQIFMLFQDNWEHICSLYEQNEINHLTSKKLEKLLSSILNATTLIQNINQTFIDVEEEIQNNTAGVFQQLNQSRLNLLDILHSLEEFNISSIKISMLANESFSYLKKLQLFGLIMIVFGILSPSLVRIFLTIFFVDFIIDFLLLRYIPGWATHPYRYILPKISSFICLIISIKQSSFFSFLRRMINPRKKKTHYSFRIGPPIDKPRHETVRYSRYYHS